MLETEPLARVDYLELVDALTLEPVPVVQGDVLTLRGLGKCVLEEVGNQTKKGRVFITVKRYL